MRRFDELLPGVIKRVIADRRCGALDWAVKRTYIDTQYFHSTDLDVLFRSMLVKIMDGTCDLYVTTYDRLLPPEIVNCGVPIINVHPSLLPAFPGPGAIRQALYAGVYVTGATVHLVDEGMDTGQILAQRAVTVNHEETEQGLAERVLHAGAECLVDVLTDWLIGG